MSYYAEIKNGLVARVANAEADWVAQQEGAWVKTSYGTRGGAHYGADGKPDGGIALRKNFASIGFSYDAVRDAFIPPKPYASWVLDEATCLWNPPVPLPAQPTDGTRVRYVWDEAIKDWVEHKGSA